MKLIHIAISIPFIIFFSLMLNAQTIPPSQENNKEQIMRMLREWGDAMSRRDVGVFNRLLHPDFTFVSPRGRLIRRETYIANRDTTGGFALTSFRFEDVSVRFYGSVAVSTSRYITSSQSRERLTGMTYQISNESARTDTWMNSNGRWTALATQLTPIGYPGAHAVSDTASLSGLNSDQLVWSENPGFPDSRVAVLYGMPYSGGYAVRVKRSDSHFEQPHYHESDEHISVASGVIRLGIGQKADRLNTKTFHAGAYVVIPAGTVHYSWAEGEVSQDVYWTGAASRILTRPAR